MQPASCREALQDVFAHLEVTSYSMEVDSSMRSLVFAFKMLRKVWRYSQCSQADVASTTWTLWKTSKMEFLPNVTAALELDGESLLGCEFSAKGGKRNRRWSHESKVSE